MIRTAVFKLCGQPATGPTAVFDQSSARINAPISPPPEKTQSIAAEWSLSPTPSSTASGGWACCSPESGNFNCNAFFPSTPLPRIIQRSVGTANAMT